MAALKKKSGSKLPHSKRSFLQGQVYQIIRESQQEKDFPCQFQAHPCAIEVSIRQGNSAPWTEARILRRRELRHLAWHDLLDQGGVREAAEFRVTNR